MSSYQMELDESRYKNIKSDISAAKDYLNGANIKQYFSNAKSSAIQNFKLNEDHQVYDKLVSCKDKIDNIVTRLTNLYNSVDNSLDKLKEEMKNAED